MSYRQRKPQQLCFFIVCTTIGFNGFQWWSYGIFQWIALFVALSSGCEAKLLSRIVMWKNLILLRFYLLISGCNSQELSCTCKKIIQNVIYQSAVVRLSCLQRRQQQSSTPGNRWCRPCRLSSHHDDDDDDGCYDDDEMMKESFKNFRNTVFFVIWN